MQRVINQQLPTNFNIMNASWDSVSTMLNAGIDMFMIPGWRGTKAISDVIVGLKTALKNGTINEDRINDAVARVISVKLGLGVATQVKTSNLGGSDSNPNIQVLIDPTLSTEYQDALNAVHESLVLLKNNNNAVPFKPSNIQYIVLVG
jgi:beta-glucosidase-like glycosyl hydrolase